jgi:HAD superfamily hydrolase (TIGR01490 family)
MNEASDKRPSDPIPAVPAVAFFDLDGTLVIGQTQVLLVRFLRRAGVVGRVFLLATGLWFLAYKAGLVKVTQQTRDKGARVFKGLTEQEVEELMVRFAAEIMVPRLHPAASSALAEHLAEGDRVVVLSAALEPVVEALCRRLGVSDYVGAPCEIAERVGGGRYTGRLSGPTPYGDEKARVAAGFMERWGADPADCWAYADHDTDLALLNSVGHPVVVNPRAALLAKAQRDGWPILP